MKKHLILAVLAALALAGSVWAAPFVDNNGVPPVGNTDEPLNVGGTDQTKAGGLVVNGISTNGLGLWPNSELYLPAVGFGAGKVLTSTADGHAVWQNPPTGGNGGMTLPAGGPGYTLRATQADNWVAANNLINDGTNIGIGIGNPTQKLDVNGNIWDRGSYFKLGQNGADALHDGGEGTLHINPHGGFQQIVFNANFPKPMIFRGNATFQNQICLGGVCRSDWPTSDSGGGNVSGGGTGTANYLTKWINGNTIGNTTIIDNPTEVRVGNKDVRIDNNLLTVGSIRGANGNVVITGNGGTGTMEMSGAPYIDFKSNASEDYDMRMELSSNQRTLQFISSANNPSQRVYIGAHPDPNLAGLGSTVMADTVVAKNLIFENGLGNNFFALGPAVGAATVIAGMGLAAYGSSAAALMVLIFAGLSDAQLKDHVAALPSVVEKIAELKPITYQWNDKYKELYKKIAGEEAPEEGKQIGLIAQDVEKVFPELVTAGPDGYKKVNYPQFTAVLLKAAQEQQVKLQDQDKKIRELEQQVAEIHETIKKSKNK